MYLQIKKINQVPDEHGNHLVITMVGLYEDNGKWIKWVKLNEALMELLLSAQIPFHVL